MYRGFNVKIESYNNYHYEVGLQLFNEIKTTTIKQFKKYVGVNGVINGSELESDWFEEIDAHIFISHSHIDKKHAIALAGFLYKKHDIKCFIDSCIWGYANDLLKQIDDKYCKNPNRNTYSYEKRNYSTSHVHMMLSAAINKMIDKCEGLFLINTPNAISTSDIQNETFSPWIYSEILTSKLIKKHTPPRHKTIATESIRKSFSATEIMGESFRMSHSIDLDHLSNLNEKEILEWGLNPSISAEDALDNLYTIKPAPKKSIL